MARHGTAFAGTSDKVTRLANICYELMMEDPALKEVLDGTQIVVATAIESQLPLKARLKMAIDIVFRRNPRAVE